jgi:CheY-like chemotaxis protein
LIRKHEIPAQYECAPGEYIQIAIKDDGCGIPEAKMSKIFDPFFTTKAIGQGTGLGLSTVQGIVRLYDGFITLDSEVGRGTIFTLNFPVVRVEPLAEEPQNTEQIPHGSESILLVDDEEMLLNATQEMLESIGYRVLALQDPQVALQQFSTTPENYDLIITDQMMPGLTGKDLIMEVRKIRFETKAILCTGYTNRVSQADVEQLGIKALLLKPLILEDLAQTVRSVLDTPGTERHL